MSWAHKAITALLFLAALALGVAAGRWLQQPAPAAAPIDWTLAFPDLDGKPHQLSEWQGKILIVNFWASWCPPCVEEMPEFAKLQQELAGQDVQFIGILVEDEAAEAQAFLQTHPVNYPILNGAIGGREWLAQLGNDAGVLPLSLVYGRDGTLAYRRAGRFGRDEVLKQLTPLLR
ncbi:MAG: TlpA family protein disulfide reductase [Candidatus Methylumidiphilus sp.]